MEIPKPQFRPPEIVPDQEPQSSQESEAKQPIGFAQNDSIERVKASGPSLHDIITGSTDGNELPGLQEPPAEFQPVIDAENAEKIKLKRDDVLTADPPTIQMPDGSFTGDARSRLEGRNTEALQNFLAEHGKEVPSGSDGTVGTAGGGGIGASQFQRPGGVGAGDIGQAIAGGPTGPGDAFASAMERYSQLIGLSKEAFDSLVAQVFDGLSAADEPAAGYGKGMIAEPFQGGDVTPAEIAAAKKRASEPPKDPPAAPKEPSTAQKAWGIVKDVLVWFAETKTPIPAPPMEKDVYENTGFGVGALLKSKDRTPETETKKGETGTVKDTTQENYVDPGVERARQLAEQAAKLLGMVTLADLRRPRIQGDVDPTPEGEPVKAEPTVVSLLGKYGMLGNPGTPEAQVFGHSSPAPLPGEGVTRPPDDADAPPTTSGPRESVNVNAQFGAALEPPAEEDDDDTSTASALENAAERLRKLNVKLDDN